MIIINQTTYKYELQKNCYFSQKIEKKAIKMFQEYKNLINLILSKNCLRTLASTLTHSFAAASNCTQRSTSTSFTSSPTHPSLIDFSSNDYLNLSKSHNVIYEGIQAALKYGAGATGSRLLSGNFDLAFEFEKQIAKDKNMPNALLFNSGFQLNSTVIAAIADKKVVKNPVIFFDKCNHASMYAGAFLSGAKLLRYNHLDYEHLEYLLQKESDNENHNTNNKNSAKFIMSETIFGMDADCANIQILQHFSQKYDTMLYFDEAHATGLYGAHGYGILNNLDTNRTIAIGTFSKAIGVSGGYVCCSDLIYQYLLQKCTGFIYSTAMNPFSVGAAFGAWKQVKNMDETRKKIFYLSDVLRKNLHDILQKNSSKNHQINNKKTANDKKNDTNIIIIQDDNLEKLLHLKEILLKGSDNSDNKNYCNSSSDNSNKNNCNNYNSIIVSLIRPPTAATNRIRIAINASHQLSDITLLSDIINNFYQKNQ